MKMNRITILSIAIAFTMLLIFVPVNAEPPYFSDGSKAIHYGDEFKQPGLGGCAYHSADFTTGMDYCYTFWLTPAQYQLLTSITSDNPDISIYDAYNQVVPDQVAALPEDLQDYLKTHLFSPKSDGYASYHHFILTSPEGQVTDEWIDPSGNIVPEKCVPERYLHPNPSESPWYFIQYYSDGRSPEYTPEMQQHLANLGLSSAYRSDIAAKSYFLDDGNYAITLTGSSPSGEELSWTFILGNDRVWRDSATGQPMDDDARFVLAAMNYVDRPSAYSVNALTGVAQTRTSTVSSIPTVFTSSSGTLANTLLSHAGTSKLSKVNIATIARTRATTTSTASTAPLVSQATVSLSDETTAGGTFDMASFAASYRSGGTEIASKGFGSDILAARGIGG
jgi:hypothetical protein